MADTWWTKQLTDRMPEQNRQSNDALRKSERIDIEDTREKLRRIDQDLLRPEYGPSARRQLHQERARIKQKLGL